MARYRLTPRAKLGLWNILDYAEREFGSRTAEDVLERIVAAFE